MIDVSIAYERYQFLGNEFLTWIWFLIDNSSEMEAYQKLQENTPFDFRIGNRVVLEKQSTDAVEKITIKGDDAGLEEGMIALRKGALVTELHLQWSKNDLTWTFTIKGESLNISTLKVPDTGKIESKEDIEGAVLEKIFLYDELVTFVIDLYHQYLETRLSDSWEKSTLVRMKKWIGA